MGGFSDRLAAARGEPASDRDADGESRRDRAMLSALRGLVDELNADPGFTSAFETLRSTNPRDFLVRGAAGMDNRDDGELTVFTSADRSYREDGDPVKDCVHIVLSLPDENRKFSCDLPCEFSVTVSGTRFGTGRDAERFSSSAFLDDLPHVVDELADRLADCVVRALSPAEAPEEVFPR